MKATFEHIELNQLASSFTAYRRKTSYFDFHWHYHPEIELTFIEQGTGTRLVGDHTESFTNGDLVLLGHNLPHTWVSESKEEGQAAIIVQFKPDLISESQLNSPEFSGIRKLLAHSQRGVCFSKEVSLEFHPVLSNLLEMRGLEKLTELWRILDQLSQINNVRLLASPIYHPNLGIGAESRIDIACQYIHEHFIRKISLPEIASIVNMTETSFCRFFKKMTGKSFTDYLNELRVSRARRLLTESETNISEIAYASGFESITHFNRVFLKKNGISPRAYRKKVKRVSGKKYVD